MPNKMKRVQEMPAPPADVFEDSDAWWDVFNGLEDDEKTMYIVKLQEELAKGDKKESVNEQLLNEIKELLMERVTKESSFMLRNSKDHREWGSYMVALGLGTIAVSLSIPVFELANVFLRGGGAFAFSGLMLMYSGYRFERIANEFPEHRERMDYIGDHKIPFDKIWFEHWRNGENIPNYRIAILLETASALLSIVSGLYLFLKIVFLGVI